MAAITPFTKARAPLKISNKLSFHNQPQKPDHVLHFRVPGSGSGDFDDQLYKQMSKECVDEVVAMLLKFAIQPTTGVQPHQLHQATVENGKRSIGLMKQCLKSAVWGDIVTIKVGWLEKELTVPPESLVRQENQAQFAQSISQSQQALEVVINLTAINLRCYVRKVKGVKGCYGGSSSFFETGKATLDLAYKLSQPTNIVLVRLHTSNCANPGLPLLVRLQSVVEKRYRTNGELMKMFLKVVLFVFEHPLLLTSDYAEKLEDAFHWGLTAQDREMREKFLIVFERNLAVNPIARLTYILREKYWEPFKDYFWLRHALWLLLRCIPASGLAVPFMTSGVHVQQAHAVHPVINILLETFSQCNPPIHIDPNATQYISRYYHSWHRGILMLENRALCIPPMLNNTVCAQQTPDPIAQENMDVLYCLGTLYSELAEQDQYAAVWNRRALTMDTVKMLAMQQLEALEWGQSAARTLLHRMENQYGKNAITEANFREYEFLDNSYIQCTKELCRWRVVCDIAKNSHVENPELLFEAAVHLPDWSLAKQCRDQIIGCIRPDFAIQSITYGAMLAVLGDPEEVPVTHPKKMVEEVTQALVVGWRVLPPILTPAHTKLLQQMTMIREVGDVLDLKRALDAGNQNCGAVMQEMKTVIKIWRSRAYSLSDDMSFISLMYDWRSQIHTMMVQQFHEWERSGIVMPPGMNPQSILPIHSAATGQLFLARAARERGMDQVAIRTLNKLHTLITLPMMDCHQKIIDHLKTLRRMAKKHTTTAQQKMDLLHEYLRLSFMDRREYTGDDSRAAPLLRTSTSAVHRLVLNSYQRQILWTAKHVVACGIYAAAGLDGVLKERAQSLMPFNWLPWLPQLMTELQERPTSEFTSIVQRIAEAYPLQIVSALRPLLDPVLIDDVIEAVATNIPLPLLPDDHKCAALCKVLERACRSRLTDVRFVDEFRAEVLEMLEATPIPVGPALLKLAESVIKWQTKLHNRLYSLPRRYPMRLSSKFLADYSSAMACIEIPSSFNANMTKQYQYVTLIARFNPYVEVVVKGCRVMKKLQIMAVNGKTCVYYLQRSVFEEKTNRCQQYLQIVKTLLVKERVGAYPMSLVAKKPYIFDVIRPLDVFAQYGMTFGMRPDDAITMFYDRLVAPDGSPQTVMLDTYRSFIIDNFVGPSILKNYVLERFTDATYYYLFRKRVAQQLAVLSVLEMLVRLSPLFLEDVSIRTSTAQLAAPRYKFTIGEDSQRIVPFRLTPNFQWFLGMTIEGISSRIQLHLQIVFFFFFDAHS
ncbi:hypothetical protein TELCIR_13354 [Teladorsagia circumcincta]|uniref:PIK-related kinase FAT domain-containing protein n=1 Tax=Teladorsagia circumcincta TaxID=45464 RepID=A0A2G9U423_TELCI|nr:hypothetical protein TELCIR_13354 [Teladorsagia circumcincta]